MKGYYKSNLKNIVLFNHSNRWANIYIKNCRFHIKNEQSCLGILACFYLKCLKN